MGKTQTKKDMFKMDKAWHWLLYIDFILPLILFIIVLLLPSSEIKQIFSKIFHNYNLFIINIVPNFISLTGILGILIHTAAIVYSIIKKDNKSLIICIIFSILIFLYFFFDINYLLIPMLEFAA